MRTRSLLLLALATSTLAACASDASFQRRDRHGWPVPTWAGDPIIVPRAIDHRAYAASVSPSSLSAEEAAFYGAPGGAERLLHETPQGR